MSDVAFALFFGSDSRPLFGWFHPAAGGARGSSEGLVICSPLGQDDINAHRTLRQIALVAARQGTPVLRFDYDGCGDSAGDDLDPDRVSHWLASVDAAIDELKRRAGVGRVCLLGLRVGALLASLAAAKRDDVRSLIAIAPTISGRAFVREWRTLGLVHEWKAASPAGDAEAPDAGTALDAPIEAAGYVMSRSTCDHLSGIDLMQLPRVAAEVLVIDRDDLPRRDRWAKHLAANGAQVTHEVLPGYFGMMSEPHNVQVPQAIVARVLSWLSRGGAAGAPTPTPLDPVVSTARVVAGVQETVLRVDDEGLQFGILSEPLSAVSGERRALVLINSGAVHHIGPNRMYVLLARQLAARGWAVLRVDVSGLGDSESHAGEPENAPYTSLALRDIEAWLSVLRQRGLGGEAHLLGICSGAYHAFKAATAGMSLASVIPVNPAVFYWRDGMPLDPPMAEHKVLQMAEVYKRSIFDRQKWVKLLTGRSDFVKATRVVVARVWARIRIGLRWIARMVGLPMPDDLVVELRKLRAHRARLHFIFSDGEVGQRILREQGGSMVDVLIRNGQISTCELVGTDHTFSSVASRRAFFKTLDAHLTSLPARDVEHDAPVGTPMASA